MSDRIGLSHARDDEIPGRIEALRRAKMQAGGLDLTLSQLDQVLPAVECRRTRIRLRRLAAGHRDLPNASVREH